MTGVRAMRSRAGKRGVWRNEHRKKREKRRPRTLISLINQTPRDADSLSIQRVNGPPHARCQNLW